MEKILTSSTRQSESLEINMNHSYSLEETPPDTLWKMKTLQLLPMHHRLITPQQLKQKSKETWQQSQKKSKSLSATPQTPQQQLQQNLQQWKDQAVPQQQKTTTAANNTGGPSTTLTKAQELCIKQFKAHHQAWNRRNKRYSDITTAQHYRLISTSMVLYLFIIHTWLYQQATSALQAAGKQYPNPLTSAHGRMATNPKFITILCQQLRQPKPGIRVESNPLRGASCYDPPTFFFPP
jgi:hypothetical protein